MSRAQGCAGATGFVSLAMSLNINEKITGMKKFQGECKAAFSLSKSTAVLNISSTSIANLKRMLARESSLVPTDFGSGMPQVSDGSNTNADVA